ncbi:MAG: PqqD family protein [Deltaproteobacteria bacterium]
MGRQDCYKREDRVIFTDLGDTGTLVDPYRRTLVKLNPAALQIWKLLDGTRPFGSLIEALSRDFEVDGPRLEKDVAAFLKDLARREMITLCSA